MLPWIDMTNKNSKTYTLHCKKPLKYDKIQVWQSFNIFRQLQIICEVRLWKLHWAARPPLHLLHWLPAVQVATIRATHKVSYCRTSSRIQHTSNNIQTKIEQRHSLSQSFTKCYLFRQCTFQSNSSLSKQGFYSQCQPQALPPQSTLNRTLHLANQLTMHRSSASETPPSLTKSGWDLMDHWQLIS